MASCVRSGVQAAVVVAFATSLIGCSGHPWRRPDFHALYATAAARPHTPVIVIPGVMGSRLRHRETGRDVWPGTVFDLVSGRNFRDLEVKEASPTGAVDVLETGDLFFEAFGRDFYGEILRTLEGPGAYHCVPAASLNAETDCVVLSWDWRRDFVESAALLEQVVARLRELRGDPGLRVDIVAHSAGGLVARYFLRYGGRDVLGSEIPEAADGASGDGSAMVRRAVLVGTPNYGSVSALQQAMMGVDLGFGLATIPPEVLATMPGLYELFPNPARSWMIDIHGQRLDVDLYDVKVWRDMQWSIFDPAVRRRILHGASSLAKGEADLATREAAFARGLERARRFHRVLSSPIEGTSTEYVVFGGDCDLTPARCLLEDVDGKTFVRLNPGDIARPLRDVDYAGLMLEPGDGRADRQVEGWQETAGSGATIQLS